MADPSHDSYLRTFGPASATGSRRLVCFPHAGGAASYFFDWRALLPDRLGLSAVQYPGRQDRLRHPHPASLLVMADHVAAALARHPGPLALFGHSLGASVAFEVARRVEQQEPGRVSHLFVSGRGGPAADRKLGKHVLTDDELWLDMLEMGGTDSALAAMPELKSLVVPTLRRDYVLLEEYFPDTGAVLHCPVTAMIGKGDAEVSADDAAAWAQSTTGPFHLRVFEGDHFYLGQHRAEVVETVVSALAG